MNKSSPDLPPSRKDFITSDPIRGISWWERDNSWPSLPASPPVAAAMNLGRQLWRSILSYWGDFYRSVDPARQFAIHPKLLPCHWSRKCYGLVPRLIAPWNTNLPFPHSLKANNFNNLQPAKDFSTFLFEFWRQLLTCMRCLIKCPSILMLSLKGI